MSESHDDLPDLIYSMSGSEKRFFSLFCVRHTGAENNLTLSLFRDLEHTREKTMNTFLDENKEKAYAKHFRFHKHRLYGQILQSLHLFHALNSGKERLRSHLHMADILIEKGLFRQAGKIIETGKAEAMKKEHPLLMLGFLKQEAELMRETNYTGKDAASLDVLHGKYMTLLEKIRIDQVAQHLADQVLLGYTRGGFIRTASEQKKGSVLLKKAMKESGKGAASARNRFLVAQAMLFKGFLTRNFREALRWSDTILGLYRDSPGMKQEFLRSWIISLHNRIVILNNLERYDQLPGPYGELRKIMTSSRNLKNRIFYASHNLLLTTCVDTGTFKTGFLILKAMEKKLRKNEVHFVNRQMEVTHYFSAACLNFGSNDMKASNRYLQKILNTSDLSHRSDLLYFSHLLEMFIQLESGKKDLLEYSLRNTRAFLCSRKKIYRFEDVIIRFIAEKAMNMNSQKEIKEGYAYLRGQLLPLTKQKFEQAAFEYFDLLSWLESKITGISFEKILQEKATAKGWSDALTKVLWLE